MEWKKDEKGRLVPVGLPPFRRYLVVAYPGDGAVVIGESDKKDEAEGLGRAYEGIEFFRVYEARSEYVTVRPNPPGSSPPYYLHRMDPSDPTARASLFEQTTAPADTTCGHCKDPIAKGDECYAAYVSPEDRELLGHRCTKSVCIDGERLDELPPGKRCQTST